MFDFRGTVRFKERMVIVSSVANRHTRSPYVFFRGTFYLPHTDSGGVVLKQYRLKVLLSANGDHDLCNYLPTPLQVQRSTKTKDKQKQLTVH